MITGLGTVEATFQEGNNQQIAVSAARNYRVDAGQCVGLLLLSRQVDDGRILIHLSLDEALLLGEELIAAAREGIVWQLETMQENLDAASEMAAQEMRDA